MIPVLITMGRASSDAPSRVPKRTPTASIASGECIAAWIFMLFSFWVNAALPAEASKGVAQGSDKDGDRYQEERGKDLPRFLKQSPPERGEDGAGGKRRDSDQYESNQKWHSFTSVIRRDGFAFAL